MKLYKAFTIFYPRRYRIILGIILAAFLLLNTVFPLIGLSYIRTMIASLALSMMSMVMLYGDMEVFAGIYNKEGGQIAGVQASFYGEKVLSLGILADRVTCFLWMLLMGIIWYIFGEPYFPLDIFSFLTGLGIGYSVVTIGVNINRFFVVTQAMMFASIIEAGIAGVTIVLFWLVLPLGSWWSTALALIASILVTFITVKIAAHYAKRSYYDV